MIALEQRIEDVEELFLGTQLVRKELDVVDQQRIDRAIVLHELLHGAQLQRLHHVLYEPL